MQGKAEGPEPLFGIPKSPLKRGEWRTLAEMAVDLAASFGASCGACVESLNRERPSRRAAFLRLGPFSWLELEADASVKSVWRAIVFSDRIETEASKFPLEQLLLSRQQDPALAPAHLVSLFEHYGVGGKVFRNPKRAPFSRIPKGKVDQLEIGVNRPSMRGSVLQFDGQRGHQVLRVEVDMENAEFKLHTLSNMDISPVW